MWRYGRRRHPSKDDRPAIQPCRPFEVPGRPDVKADGDGPLRMPWKNVITPAHQYDPNSVDGMTTYSIREAKAHLSEILRDLDRGDEVIITRRGRPCGRLTAVDAVADDRPTLSTLKGALSQLPDTDYQDFLDIKGIWETGERLPDGVSGGPAVDTGG